MTSSESWEDRFKRVFEEGEAKRRQLREQRDRMEQDKVVEQTRRMETVRDVYDKVVKPMLKAFGKAAGEEDVKVHSEFVGNPLKASTPFRAGGRSFAAHVSLEATSENLIVAVLARHTPERRDEKVLASAEQIFPLSVGSETIGEWLGLHLEEAAKACIA